LPFDQNDFLHRIGFLPSINLFNAVGLAMKILKDAIFVKDNNSFRKIKFSEIPYVKSRNRDLEIFVMEGKSYLFRSTLCSLIEILPDSFFRVHRSYIINLNFLESINAQDVLVKGQQVPISKKHRNELLQIVHTE
jgi:two-component system, LytTR family, response regulator